MSPAVTPKFVYSDATQLVATWRNVVVSVLGRSAMTVAGAREQVAACEAHGRACGPKRLLEIVLIDREAPVPAADVRAVLDAAVATVGPYYLGVATLFEGTGFRAAVVRGVLTSLSLLSRTEFQQQVFSSTAECSSWCAQLLARSTPSNAAELTAVIDHVRRAGIERAILVS